jgi:hypothetical protein
LEAAQHRESESTVEISPYTDPESEALERQEPFINQALAYQALALLARLLRHDEITYHGAFIDLKTGRMAPITLQPQEERRAKWKQL